MEIKSEEEYENSLERVEKIFDAKEGDPDFPELTELVDAIEKYEDIHYPMGEDDGRRDF